MKSDPTRHFSVMKGDRMSETRPPDEDLTYEEAFAELEKIVSALETGEHTLDEAIAQYERGQTLAKLCANLLDKAELKVQQLSADEIIDFES
jgi:exodeoxyribonuclease VII small subunit